MDDHITRLLVAIDGSPQSLRALHYGIGLIRQGLRARLLLVTVQEPTYLYETLAPGPDVLDRLTGAVGARCLSQAQRLCRDAQVDHASEITSGDPAAALLRVASEQGCESILIGARGLGAVRSALMGSVSREVLRNSALPVTVVPGDWPRT